MNADIVRLQADQDQDIEECLAWWKRQTSAGRGLIWDMIQADTAGQNVEIVLRFAQLGFSHIALLAEAP